MKTKLASLAFVAVLLACSCSGIIAVTHAKVVSGTTAASAQAPQFAPLNPAFISYQQNLSAGKVSAGIVPSPINLSQLKGQSIRSALVGASSLPASYDLRPTCVTLVKAQGSCGDCWAFATYASLESYLKKSLGETWDFSENNLKNTYGFDTGPCGGGNDFMSTAYLARWSGPVNETVDPYNPSSGSSPANLPVQKHVQDVYVIPDRANSTDNDNIKTAVMTYGAIYTEFYWDSSYYNTNTIHAYYDPHAVGETGLNHGVAIVGWDDNYAASNFSGISGRPSGNGAWIVKNSWGTNWGDSGYFYVSYYDANIGRCNAAFTAQPTTNYNNIYQYDPLGATGSFGQGTPSEWGANVFTATASQNLTAVSFYTFSLSAPYDVYVYINPTSGPINASGAVEHVSGVLSLPGYHTMPLGSSIQLQQGQKFSVVVKFTSTSSLHSDAQNYYYPVPTEGPISGYSSGATAKAGQSYYHADDSSWSTGSNWHDMTSSSANTNICIKAFTTGPAGVTLAGAPAVTAQNANSLDLFVNGTTGALYHKYWTGSTWTASTSLGGNSTADPAATSRAPGSIDVFTRSTDGALWSTNTTNNGTSWSSWYSIGGQLAAGTGPAADARGLNSLDVFVQGTDHVLYYTHWDGTAWSAWHSLGGALTSSPAATSPGNGSIDVFVRGTDGAIWERTTTNGGTTWSNWASLGGQLASGTGPAASSQGSRLDVFAEGTTGALYQKTSTGSWSGWINLGGALTSSPAATSPTSGVIDVFVRGTDNALWERAA